MDLDIFEKNNIKIYSFQSITYGLNNFNIFDDNTRNFLFDHLIKVIDYGILHNIKVFVFGCPKNRSIFKKNGENDEIFCNFFRELGHYIGNHELKICIEPNSKKYGCNYINTIQEAGELVRQINNKNIKMMVDIGNIMMENDNIEDIYLYKDILCNVDISQEHMLDFRKPNQYHKRFVKILQDINYKNNKTLEMLIKTDEDELEILRKSLYNFIRL
jgi:sugar phosphate isomerase/epimerase